MAAARASVVDPAVPAATLAGLPALEAGTSGAAGADLPSEVIAAFSSIALAHGTAELGRLLMAVAQGATSLLGVSRCAIYLRDDESHLFQGHCAYGASGIGDAIRGSVCGQRYDGLTREIVATRGPVVVPDARQDSRPVRSAVLEWGVRSLVGAPIVHAGEVIGLIFLDDGRRLRLYGQRDLSLLSVFCQLVSGLIAHAHVTERLRDEAKVLDGQNRALQLTVAFGDRLAFLVADGAGLGDVAGLVAQFTGKACGIYDRHGRCRATAVPPDMPEGSETRFASELAAIPDVADAVAAAKPGRASVVTPTGADGRRRRLLLLRAPDESPEGGTILLDPGGTQRLHVLDAKVVRRAAAMVDLIVRAEINKSECLRALTADLLLGRDLEGIEERARQHEIDLADLRVVCVIGGDDVTPPRSELVEAFAEATGQPPRMVAELGGDVAFVFGIDADTPAPDAIDALSATIAGVLAGPGRPLRAGVSSACRGVDDYPHALAEARSALDRAREADAVVALDDLAPGRLLDPGRAARFARAVMAPLLADESAGGTDLILTLETFFDCSRNIRRTAEYLDIHENTVRYRLASVLRRTGLDIARNPRDQLNVQLALELLRDGQRPCQRGGRFSANASAPSEASSEWNTGIASSS